MNPDTDAELRRSAEARLQTEATPVAALPVEDAQRLLHELQVHQVELEMQNESLHAAMDAEDQALFRYTELFDFAPIGYFVLDHSSKITQVNLLGASLLGFERLNLTGRRFLDYVSHEHRVMFCDFLAKAFETGEKQNCEILLQVGEHNLWLSLEANIGITATDCLVAMADITELKQTEHKLASEENMFRQMFEKNTAVKLLIDPEEGFIVNANTAACQFYGYSLKTIKKMKIGDINTLHADEVKREMEKARII
jgi:PAS domain S-box-containing protein